MSKTWFIIYLRILTKLKLLSEYGAKSTPTIVWKNKEEHQLNGSREIWNMSNVLRTEHETDLIAKEKSHVFDIYVHLTAKRLSLI